MLSVYGCKTKKDLKTKVGTDASRVFQETSMFSREYLGAGEYAVVGPAPTERRWYALVVVDADGRIVKVV